MKHIKTYESENKKYEKFDYILINIPYNYSGNMYFTDFINNNIGIIMYNFSVDASRVSNYISKPGDLVWYVEILYTNVPDNIKGYFMNSILRTTDEYIVKISKNIDDLNSILASNKYNL